VEDVLGLFASEMNLFFRSNFITRSDLGLELFCKTFLLTLFIAARVVECLLTRNLLMIVVRLSHVGDCLALELRLLFIFEGPLHLRLLRLHGIVVEVRFGLDMLGFA